MSKLRRALVQLREGLTGRQDAVKNCVLFGPRTVPPLRAVRACHSRLGGWLKAELGLLNTMVWTTLCS
jgi:hypothetical protein